MNEAEKTQAIRLADVFLIGPVMMYAGLGKRMPEMLRLALFAFGALTIIYNGANYLALKRGNENVTQGKGQ